MSVESICHRTVSTVRVVVRGTGNAEEGATKIQPELVYNQIMFHFRTIRIMVGSYT